MYRLYPRCHPLYFVYLRSPLTAPSMSHSPQHPTNATNGTKHVPLTAAPYKCHERHQACPTHGSNLHNLHTLHTNTHTYTYTHAHTHTLSLTHLNLYTHTFAAAQHKAVIIVARSQYLLGFSLECRIWIYVHWYLHRPHEAVIIVARFS
jgi:hypothetical protein